MCSLKRGKRQQRMLLGKMRRVWSNKFIIFSVSRNLYFLLVNFFVVYIAHLLQNARNTEMELIQIYGYEFVCCAWHYWSCWFPFVVDMKLEVSLSLYSTFYVKHIIFKCVLVPLFELFLSCKYLMPAICVCIPIRILFLPFLGAECVLPRTSYFFCFILL